MATMQGPRRLRADEVEELPLKAQRAGESRPQARLSRARRSITDAYDNDAEEAVRR